MKNKMCKTTECNHKGDGPCQCRAENVLRHTRVIESKDLFADKNEVEIRHAGELYRLRVTRNGKLILNK